MTTAAPVPTDLRARADWRNVVVACARGGRRLLARRHRGAGDYAARHDLGDQAHRRPLIGERALGADPPSRIGIVALALALMLHGMLSLVYGMLVLLAVRRLRLIAAVVAGAVFGGALYAVNYHLLTGLFTSFAAFRGLMALAAYIAFGVAVIVVYAALHSRAAMVALARVGDGHVDTSASVRG